MPGGFVRPEQDLLETAQRKLANKTGVKVEQAHLEQLQTYGKPNRDPRMRVVTVAYLALVADPPEPELETAQWHHVDAFGNSSLTFDHFDILAAGIERSRSKLEYTTLGTSFCRQEFTMAELRSVYEAVWGHTLDPANFHRKVMATEGFVKETGNTESSKRGRPARTFNADSAKELHPPIVRTTQ